MHETSMGLEKRLEPGEEILWSAKPVKKAFIFKGIAAIPVGLFVLSFFVLCLTTSPIRGTQEYKWQPVESPTNEELNSVFMLSSNDGWAVGGRLVKGLILYWNGKEWTVTKNIERNLRDIFMLSSNDGWAVGDFTVLRWNGVEWSEVRAGRSWGELYSIYMLSAQEGWAVGEKGMIWHWDGSAWSLRIISSGIGERGFMIYPYLKSVFMLSSNEGWAVGSELTPVGGGGHELRGVIFRWDGNEWYKVTKFSDIHLINSIHMLSSNEGWACGTMVDGRTGIIIRWDGDNWNIVENSISEPLKSIYMLSSNEGWAARSKIWRWDGNWWSEVEQPFFYGLNSIHMLSSTEGWAVGSNGTILKYGVAESGRGGIGEQGQLLLWSILILTICIALSIFLSRRGRLKKAEQTFDKEAEQNVW
jgi:photosystem II stability/assembly factor-like uncharacterized protein